VREAGAAQHDSRVFRVRGTYLRVVCSQGLRHGALQDAPEGGVSCYECDRDDLLPWEEDEHAHDRAVDLIACETVGHRIRAFETGGQRCLRCHEIVRNSDEGRERTAQYERDTAGMSPFQKFMYLEMQAINARMTAFGNARITDLTDEALSPSEPT
jgi:hypothetical protein